MASGEERITFEVSEEYLSTEDVLYSSKRENRNHGIHHIYAEQYLTIYKARSYIYIYVSVCPVWRLTPLLEAFFEI